MILETRAEERFRLERLIAETNAEFKQVEQNLDYLESQLPEGLRPVTAGEKLVQNESLGLQSSPEINNDTASVTGRNNNYNQVEASMQSRLIYAIIGGLLVALTDLLINLLASVLYQRAFTDQFAQQSMWVLIVLIVFAVLLGSWLGEELKLQPTEPYSRPNHQSEPVTMTRLKALFSYAELRGKSIYLSDILLIGSRIKINTKD